MQPRRRLRAERPVPRRHAPARRDRGHAGVSGGRRRPARVLRRQPRPPCRHRRQHAGLDAAVQPDASTRRACSSTTSCWCATASCARPNCWRSLGSGRYPARNPQQTLADLRAQIAANQKGVEELQAMVAQFGRDTVAAYMQHVQDNAEESVRRVITALKDGSFELALDNGARDPRQGDGAIPRRARPPSTSAAPARSCRTTSTRRRR